MEIRVFGVEDIGWIDWGIHATVDISWNGEFVYFRYCNVDLIPVYPRGIPPLGERIGPFRTKILSLLKLETLDLYTVEAPPFLPSPQISSSTSVGGGKIHDFYTLTLMN